MEPHPIVVVVFGSGKVVRGPRSVVIQAILEDRNATIEADTPSLPARVTMEDVESWVPLGPALSVYEITRRYMNWRDGVTDSLGLYPNANDAQIKRAIEWQDARKRKDFVTADAIRFELQEQDILIHYHATWL
jgi:hypothetical protein